MVINATSTALGDAEGENVILPSVAADDGAVVVISSMTVAEAELYALTINVFPPQVDSSKSDTIIDSNLKPTPSKKDVGVIVKSSSQATRFATPCPNSISLERLLRLIATAKTPPPTPVAISAINAKTHFGFNLFFEDSKDPSKGEVGIILLELN